MAQEMYLLSLRDTGTTEVDSAALFLRLATPTQPRLCRDKELNLPMPKLEGARKCPLIICLGDVMRKMRKIFLAAVACLIFAVVYAFAGEGNIEQVGRFNRASISQVGPTNTALLRQGPVGYNSAQVYQARDGANVVLLTQTGSHNTALQRQFSGSGTMLLVQRGMHNKAEQSQYAAGNVAVGVQQGSGNYLVQRQYIPRRSPLVVYQRGRGVVTVVIQR